MTEKAQQLINDILKETGSCMENYKRKDDSISFDICGTKSSHSIIYRLDENDDEVLCVVNIIRCMIDHKII